MNNCRFYENIYPDVDDVVVANVKSLAEMGAYVKLLEYNNIEGMILLSELSRRRIRSLNKVIRVGRNEFVVVLRVDKEKGYIDLSKRRVSPEEVAAAEEKFNRAKVVNNILRHVSEATHLSLEEIYQKTAWVLDRKRGGKGLAYDAFKKVVNEPDEILNELNLEPSLKNALIANIKKRLTAHPIKIRADIDVFCYGYEGIDAVKAALQKGLDTSTDDYPIKINLIAPPSYVITTISVNKDDGIQALQNAISAIEMEIHKRKGSLVIDVAPRAVTETDDKQLTNKLEDLMELNREKDGDDSDDSTNNSDDSSLSSASS